MPSESPSLAQQLNRSFTALCHWLEQPRAALSVVVVLLAIHSGLLAYSAYVHSPTLNEPGHLVAGLSHWKFGRFELYRVNPPLVKMVAALPVMAVGYEEDWSGFYEGPGARPIFAMGENFVAANGERSFFLFMIARWACIPFSWIGAITCYLWARDLYGHSCTTLRVVNPRLGESRHTGRPAGVLACAFWCFEPNILAHAALITPDIGGTALGVAACYTFWRWLVRPTWTQAALTGVVLGLAELAKTTLILFYPLWPLLWIIYRWPEWRKSRESASSRQGAAGRGQNEDDDSTSSLQPPASSLFPQLLREAGMLALRMAIGLYILNLGYGFEGTGTQLKEFHFVSKLFTEGSRQKAGGSGQDKNDSTSSLQPPASNLSPHNRFAHTWLGHLPVPFPKNYLLGIDIQQRDFESYGRPSYLRGEWRDHGWWYYYLYAAAIKVPLALWLLALLALLTDFQKQNPSSLQLPTAPRPLPTALDTFILLAPPLVIFTVASMKTGFSEHFRYVLPCFPFLFIWISRIARVGQRILPVTKT